MKRLTEAQAAYLAGYVDADGTIAMNRQRVPNTESLTGWYYRSFLSVISVDKPTLELFRRWTGLGQVKPCSPPGPRARQGWRWVVWSRAAAGLVDQLLPHLTSKRARGRLLVQFQRGCKGNALLGNRRMSARQRERQHACWLRMRALNVRGSEGKQWKRK